MRDTPPPNQPTGYSVGKEKFTIKENDRCYRAQKEAGSIQYSSLLQLSVPNPCLKAQVIAAVKNIDAPMLTRVWQELEYRIDVCRVTHDAHIEHL
jgi:hypothetical protein